MTKAKEEFRFYLRFFGKTEAEVTAWLIRFRAKFPAVIKTELVRPAPALRGSPSSFQVWLYFIDNEDMQQIKTDGHMQAMFMAFQK